MTEAQLAEIYAHAREAFPAECCGYVTDVVVRCANAWTSADRTTETAFAIDGAELFALARSFGGPAPARVVYHSHTNGRAYFSALDRAVAVTPDGPAYPVDHLVVGVTASRVIEAARFAWDGADYVEIARWSVP
jgi:proteasome lid subunit RPN8/RPN11